MVVPFIAERLKACPTVRTDFRLSLDNFSALGALSELSEYHGPGGMRESFSRFAAEDGLKTKARDQG